MIFISYRRDDTLAWAGRLHADLSRRFGADRVFMDINGGIVAGDRFETKLLDALDRCQVLLALIGPQWLTCQRDGRRRLDHEDDWVRREVAKALTRGVVVVPLLLGQAAPLRDEQLPEEIRTLTRWQASPIRDDIWDDDVARLAEALSGKVTPSDVGQASQGLTLLRGLMAGAPAVADAVGRSREVIANAYRQIDRLEAFKTVHDGLHTIEFECLRPLQEDTKTTRLRPFKFKLASVAQRISDCIAAGDIGPALRGDIAEQLALAASALEAAAADPQPARLEAAIGELNQLLSGLPPRLDEGIGAAASELGLDRLVELMTLVRERLAPRGVQGNAELAPFVHSIDALDNLRNQLQAQVSEHALLQRLDAKLRSVCLGGSVPASVAAEWPRIKRVRAQIQPPHSLTVDRARPEMDAGQDDIEAALKQGQADLALDLLRDYFRVVASVFRDVDSNLKDFCLRLGEIGQPLRTVLAML